MSRPRFSVRFLTLTIGLGLVVVGQISPGSGLHAQHVAKATSGMRTLQGRHLTLVTDLPASPEVDRLPGIFDQAFAQWAGYFRVEAERLVDWHVRGYLMRNDQRFRDQGLLPADLPPFLHGYQQGDSIWLREQPSDYYQRHLMLHEGTHAFMQSALGGTGASWYMEGVAEFLATHRFQNGQLRLKSFPRSRADVPHWGRIKIIRDSVAAGRTLSIADVLRVGGADFQHVDAYAWSWAAVVFLESNPRFSERFAELQQRAQLPRDQFSAWFWRELQRDQRQLQDAWAVFLSQLDYGYDARADSIHYRPVRAFQETTRLSLKTDWGWQSTGLRLSADQSYRIRARGRYQLVSGSEVWWSEAGGVTIQYHDGLPKGILMAALGEQEASAPSFARPVPLGVGSVLRPEREGVLFLRINEPAGQRADNRGQLLVQIEMLAEAPPN